MKLSIKLRKWHKWLTLIVGVQVLLWTISGLFMSFVPIETIRSEQFVKALTIENLDNIRAYVPLTKVIEDLKPEFKDLKEIKIRTLLGEPVFEVKNEHGDVKLVHALNGNSLSPLSEELARKIALSRYAGSNGINKIQLISKPVIEFRSKYPVWRVDFDDENKTSFYISPDSGELKAVRGKLWRIYDFLWMLHIMDYSERENFNHWWLILAAFLAVSVSVTGVGLFFFSFKKRDFKFLGLK